MPVETRRIRLVDVNDINSLKQIWEKVSKQEQLFDDFTFGHPEVFLSIMTEPSSFHALIGESGLMTARAVYERSNCNVHIAVWDNEMPFTELINECLLGLGFLFDEKKVNRATTYISVYNKPAIRLATLLGFKYEGCMRKATPFQGEFYDTNFYGMLQQEWEKTKLLNKVG